MNLDSSEIEAADLQGGEGLSAGSSKRSKRSHSSCQGGNAEIEVIALSPRTLLAQHDDGYQHYHQRIYGHHPPQGLAPSVIRRVYVCPDPSCAHHSAAKGLSDLTGIKKHFSRKHGERRWRCERCSRAYAVLSDFKAHTKICGTRNHRCELCGDIFTRKDSYNKHKDFCRAIAHERAILSSHGGDDVSKGRNPELCHVSDFSSSPSSTYGLSLTLCSHNSVSDKTYAREWRDDSPTAFDVLDLSLASPSASLQPQGIDFQKHIISCNSDVASRLFSGAEFAENGYDANAAAPAAVTYNYRSRLGGVPAAVQTTTHDFLRLGA